jgi:hypothetical protein
MLTGKTIGQLNYLSSPTADTLFPVELSGITYYIYFSSITNNIITPTPSILCEDLLTPTPPSGQCQNSLAFLINQSITTWCVENPPFVVCNEGQDPFNGLLNIVVNAYNEDNIIPPICTTGENPLKYLINEAIFSFNNQPI